MREVTKTTWAGVVIMADQTLLEDNRVLAAQSRRGAAIFVASTTDSEVYYVLPAPAAHYITLTIDCRESSSERQDCVGVYDHHPELGNAIVARVVGRVAARTAFWLFKILGKQYI